MRNLGRTDSPTEKVKTGGPPGATRVRLADPRPGFPGTTAAPAMLNGWAALEIVLRRWSWLALGIVLGGVVFFLLGQHFIRPKFTAVARLMRFEAIGRGEFFKTTPLSGDSFASLIRAPELLSSVGSQLTPRIPPEILVKMTKVESEPDSDFVNVYLAARDARQAVDWLNTYLTNAVEYTRGLEAAQLQALASGYLKKEVQEIDQDVTEVERQFLNLPSSPQSTNRLVEVNTRLNALGQRMEKAVADLDDLRTRYTDIHPKVQAQQEAIGSLRLEMAQAATNRSATSVPLSGPVRTGAAEGLSPELDILHIKLRALEDGRLELLKRLREAELYAANTPGSVRVFAPATLATVKSNHRWLKVAIAPFFGAGLGLVVSLFLVMLVEFLDQRIRSADDLFRITRLPVMASLGDLRAMDPKGRAQWAFRAWTMLQGRLAPAGEHGLICGVTSSAPGEGRSTWISLLAEAASLTGYRVLTIATRPSPTHIENGEDLQEDEFFSGESRLGLPSARADALTSSVLSSPARVTEQLTGSNPQPVVHIPLPGWVWSLERRKQWREALSEWRQIDNLVILVELPPASVPEAVLLGANLPNVVWLANSETPDAAETRAQLETLRNARCNLVGAVLNRISGTPVRRMFPRWIGCLLALAFVTSAVAQTPEPPRFTEPPVSDPEPDNTQAADPEPAPSGSFSIVGPDQRSPWQSQLTLGPGDVLNFDLYGQPELTLREVAIAPDGRVSYLEATNVLASGLTIDQLRTRLDEELSRFRRAPHTMITPTAFKSKKYFMLGRVATKGVYILDRPLTVLEALARAHGLESALVDRNLVELTDFQHSFLARAGKRFPLNFEALFQRGDLSQNIAVEPGDYIYFAPGGVQEVYVVGEVRLPGPVVYTPNLTIISAVAQRGGYTDRAFRARVLVVRGSLTQGGATAVDTHAILDGRSLNYRLQPKDIIYVNSRPFIKVEEAADLATTAFIQSVITSWVGVDILQPINQ
jgi:protein involved in polysaccharide export with SLBB domain/capsular polysaccharide biosynthesis protein